MDHLAVWEDPLSADIHRMFQHPRQSVAGRAGKTDAAEKKMAPEGPSRRADPLPPAETILQRERRRALLVHIARVGRWI
jgi:hypothetical protein